MKQNKYIPGDWVKYKGKLAKVLETYKINYFIKTYHHDYNPDIEYDDAYFSVEARPQDIEPIPLTPEILEKNGWEKVTYSSSKGQSTFLAKDFDDDVSRITVAFYKQAIKAKVWHNGYILGIYLSDIHQLQHFLFGLGLDSNFDLTDTKKGE